MSQTDVRSRKSGGAFSGSLWGVLGGVALGVGIAVAVTSFAANPLLFITIVSGSSLLGGIFGNAIESILTGDSDTSGYTRRTPVSAQDLEQSRELIEHLRLRESEVKQKLQQETKELLTAKTRPPATQPPLFSDPATGRFQTMLNAQAATGGASLSK